jgi:Domain of unknown function (DUF4124)
MKVWLTLLLALPLCAQADIYLCTSATGHQSIQDRPCGKNQRQKAYVDEHRARAVPAPSRPLAGKPGVAVATEPEPKLRRNKSVICRLLDTEKAEAEAQIAGHAAPVAGENPRDNLLKIERQRSRVGCAVS